MGIMRLSPYLLILIIAIMLIGVVANAQITLITGTVSRVWQDGTLESQDGKITYPKQDTILSRLLVSIDDWEFNQGRCYVMSGYEVVRTSGLLTYPETTIEWSYLDENKKPLPKNINVWMSKPIEK
ncbi:MAG: hypothetical protein QOA70_06820 [Nitrososphaeraceae archaeon]|nr:hypothetical protein [Nitrososphaeraceae archaeon]